MRERLSQWADYFGAVGLALWAAAAILKLLGNQPDERLIVLAVVGLIAIALYVYLRPSAVRAAVTSRGARYGSNSLIITLAFIGIVAVLSFLGNRYHWRYDTTANKTYTLSQLTTQVLGDLKQPVQATAFYLVQGASDPASRQGAEDRLKEYERAGNGKFTYRFVDPQENPQLANEYKVQFEGTIVLERGTRRENVFSSDESEITNALVKVTQDTQPTVYFTTGHGEHDPGDTGTNGYSLMKTAMETENYKVDTLNLRTITSTLPADTSMVVIAGARSPFDPQEVQILLEYLGKGGRALVMLDPFTEAGLDGLLNAWGIYARNDMIVDPKYGFFGQAAVPVITSYKSHAVTQDLAGEATFFPSVRSLWTGEKPATDRTLTALFSSSDQSWGETNLDSLKNNTQAFDATKDAKGPLDLALVSEGTGPNPGRLVVIGNSSFITNGTLSTRVNVGGQQQQVQSGNGLLFGNTLHWFAGQENLIAIPPKPSDSHPIFLTAEQSNFVFLSSFLMLPGIILIVGAIIWWRRR